MLASNPVKAIAAKNTRIASLMITMMALVVADSLAPRTSRKPHMITRRIGGRLMFPGWKVTLWWSETNIGERSCSGICQPNAFIKKLFR